MGLDVIGLLSTDGYIVVNKKVAHAFGLQAAVLLGELCSEHKYWEAQGDLDEGYFYSTQENIEYNTSLSISQQKRIVDKLVEAGVLSVKLQGCPAKKYYKINVETLFSVFDEPSIDKMKNLESSKQAINNNKETIIKEDNTISLTRNSPEVESGNEISDFESHSYSPQEMRESFLGSVPKKKKSKKPSLYSKCESENCRYTKNIALQDKLNEYLQLRLKMTDKPIYGVNQWIALLNRLSEVSGETVLDESVSQRIKVVSQSIERGWASFFELSSGKASNNKYDIQSVSNEGGQVHSIKNADEKIIDQKF